MPGKSRFFSLLGLALLLVCRATLVRAQPELSTDRYFRLSWPIQFEQVPPRHPAVRLFLKFGGAEYPTANIVEIPGPKSSDPLPITVLNDYKAVGLNSAEITDSPSPRSDTLEITYDSDGVRYRSSVTEINGDSERHFVLTYIDTQASFEGHRTLLNELLNSLVINVAQEEPVTGSSLWPRLALLGIACLACFLVVKRVRKA